MADNQRHNISSVVESFVETEASPEALGEAGNLIDAWKD